MSGPAVVLVGPSGAGKSTVGRLLAQRLGVGFRDTDADVEAATGTSIGDLFVEHGEARFRALERAAVEAALTEHAGVLAVGGGAVLDPAIRERLHGRRVAFLDVGVADASRRIGLNRDRPLLVGNVRARWITLMDARRPLYEEVATVTVATDGASPDDSATAVLAALGMDAG